MTDGPLLGLATTEALFRELPCTSCATLADCSRCADFGAWLAATEPPAPPHCAICEDADFMVLCGEATEQVAARLGVLPKSLERHLFRHGRTDLIPRRADW